MNTDIKIMLVSQEQYENMTPSQQAKAAGIKSLAAVTRLTGVSKSTLFDWHKNKPRLFAIVLRGCRLQGCGDADLE